MKTWYDKAEDQLERELMNGLITQTEYNKEMRALQREYQEEARSAAEQAYNREMENW